MTRSLALLAILGCGGPSSEAPAAPVPSLVVPPMADAAPSASSAKPAVPRIDASCVTTDDCEPVFVGDDCCHVCAPRIANKTWKREIEAYCAKDDNRGKCEPMGCSWAFEKPRCEKGLCK